jgi:hypothetical protein
MRIQLALFALFVTPTIAHAEDDRDFNTELLQIEEEVNSMKKNVFQAKATLNLLRELVVQGSSAGSRATIWHVNDLGRTYVVESVSYILDGNSEFVKTDVSGEMNSLEEMMVFEGGIPTGKHTLSVEMRLRGNGYGLFSYVDKYGFNVQSSTVFSSEEGQSCTVRVIAEKKSGLSYSFYERPNIVFQPICSEMSE